MNMRKYLSGCFGLAGEPTKIKPFSELYVSILFEERKLGEGQSSSLSVHQAVIALIMTVASSILEYD